MPNNLGFERHGVPSQKPQLNPASSAGQAKSRESEGTGQRYPSMEFQLLS